MTFLTNYFKKFRQLARGEALSLKRVIVLGMVFGILVPALVVGPLLAADSYRREIDARVHSLLSQYAQILEQTMATPIWLVDAFSAQTFVDSVMLNPDVVKIVVEDSSLGVFVRTEKPDRDGGSVVREVRPVMKEGQQIGRITIEMTTSLVERQFFIDMLKVSAALLMQLLVSFFLLLMLFERRLMRPLRQLKNDAQRLSNGQLDQPVFVMRRDELGLLAEGLDQMRVKLGQHIDQIGELNLNLERRVSERTQALNVANEELLSAMATLQNAEDTIRRSERLAALGALVAGVAHELNTPIGVCVTLSTSMQHNLDQLITAMDQGLKRATLVAYAQHAKQGMEILVRNLDAAAELIGSFKQVAVDRTSSQRRSFVLSDVVAAMVGTVNVTLGRDTHELQMDIPPGIAMTSYPGSLSQVLGNLINNARLHGFEHKSRGVISIAASRLLDDRVVLIVSDNGEGIPEAHLGRIFDPFFTTKLGRGGSGLGLNIVHNLVSEVLGGTIRVESELGIGTRFILTLPIIAPTESRRAENEAAQN